jgi:methyl-accepting chemotaxis protein
MAVNKTINIDINQNADEAAKGFNNLNKSLDATNESIRDVNATFEQVYGELQPLTTRLGEAEDRLYELSLAGETTSKEYQELLKTVANYRKVQIQTDLAVDNAATTLDQKLGGAVQGAVSGFAAVQGAMALVGSESEQLEKTLLKVQGALAIAEGVRGIRENIGFIKQLGSTVTGVFNNMTKSAKIFTATGIGLAITAVATLTDVFKSTTKKRITIERQ